MHVTLQNQGGYEQMIDKYLQSSQGSRPDLVQLPEYTVQMMSDTDSVIPIEACIEATAFDTTPFLPRGARRLRHRGRAVVDAVQHQRPGPVLPQAASSRRPGSIPTRRRRRSRSSAPTRSRSSTPAPRPTASRFDTGFDSGGGWFVEQWFAKLGEFYADNENGRSAPATRVLYDNPIGRRPLLAGAAAWCSTASPCNVGDNASGQDTFLKLADRSRRRR